MRKNNPDVEISEEEREKIKKQKRAKRKRIRRFWDRLAGIFIVAGIVAGVAALSLEYIIIKGPSEALRDVFVNTMFETRRFKFIPRIFLTEAEFKEIASHNLGQEVDTNPDGWQFPEGVTVPAPEAISIPYDDDGVFYETFKRGNFAGNVIIIKDPKRVFVGMPNGYGGVGLTLEEMVKKYDAKGGINAGGFKDDGGTGMGGVPQGLTFVDGVCYNNETYTTEGTAAFDADGVLHLGYFTEQQCYDMGIVDAVSFGPILVASGTAVDPEYLSSGINPRTAIGQREDGAVIFLVIDGRRVTSAGATYVDLANLMMDYGAVNAINMDGGSSTIMWYKGEYVNNCSAAFGTSRLLPTAFLFK